MANFTAYSRRCWVVSVSDSSIPSPLSKIIMPLLYPITAHYKNTSIHHHYSYTSNGDSVEMVDVLQTTT
jgi:hypothetical protein